MKLTIVSLRKIEYSGEAVSINIQTADGEITVLDNHRPLISLLKKGTAVITKGAGEKISLNVESGFLEVGTGNTVNVLMNS